MSDQHARLSIKQLALLDALVSAEPGEERQASDMLANDHPRITESLLEVGMVSYDSNRGVYHVTDVGRLTAKRERLIRELRAVEKDLTEAREDSWKSQGSMSKIASLLSLSGEHSIN